MITVEMTAREVVEMICHVGFATDLGKRLTTAIAHACGECGTKLNVTLRSMPSDSMISCIKALRLATGWGLKESKDFCDVVRGKYTSGGYLTGGTPNTLSLKHDAALNLAREWKNLGCDVVTDNWGC